MSESMNLSELSEQELRESYTFDDLVKMVSNIQEENQKLHEQIAQNEKDPENAVIEDCKISKQKIESLSTEIAYFKGKAAGYKKQLDEKSKIEEKMDILSSMESLNLSVIFSLADSQIEASALKMVKDKASKLIERYNNL